MGGELLSGAPLVASVGGGLAASLKLRTSFVVVVNFTVSSLDN